MKQVKKKKLYILFYIALQLNRNETKKKWKSQICVGEEQNEEEKEIMKICANSKIFCLLNAFSLVYIDIIENKLLGMWREKIYFFFFIFIHSNNSCLTNESTNRVKNTHITNVRAYKCWTSTTRNCYTITQIQKRCAAAMFCSIVASNMENT